MMLGMSAVRKMARDIVSTTINTAPRRLARGGLLLAVDWAISAPSLAAPAPPRWG
jgi:hypothetical protein